MRKNCDQESHVNTSHPKINTVCKRLHEHKLDKKWNGTCENLTDISNPREEGEKRDIYPWEVKSSGEIYNRLRSPENKSTSFLFFYETPVL